MKWAGTNGSMKESLCSDGTDLYLDCGDGTDLCLDHGGGFKNLSMR